MLMGRRYGLGTLPARTPGTGWGSLLAVLRGRVSPAWHRGAPGTCPLPALLPSLPDARPSRPPFPSCVPSPLQIMEVASPTAGSVLVELSQLRLLQVCREVAVRTMSPHGESADSIPAPVPPALVAACPPATVSCPSPRPGSEARPPLAPASPGPGDPSSPLRRPDPRGTREPPGGPPAGETPKGSHEEPPAPCAQVLYCGRRGQAEAGRRPRAWALPHCLPFQDEAGAAVSGASEDGRASEPSAAERAPDPAASPLAKEEALPAPCSAQGALGRQVPCAEGCRGGDPGSGLRPRAEVRGWGHTGPSHRIGAASLPLPAQIWVSSPLIFCSGLCSESAAMSLHLPRFLFSFGLLSSFPPHLPAPTLCTPPIRDMPPSPSAKGPLSFRLGLTLPEPLCLLRPFPLSSFVSPLTEGGHSRARGPSGELPCGPWPQLRSLRHSRRGGGGRGSGAGFQDLFFPEAGC